MVAAGRFARRHAQGLLYKKGDAGIKGFSTNIDEYYRRKEEKKIAFWTRFVIK
jgi:hypothetical protein